MKLSEPERRFTARAGLVVFLAAVVAHLWTLFLPFQLDDYLLLADPLALFAHVAELEAQGVPAFMVRWPLWLVWAAVLPLAGDPLSPLPFHAVGLLLHGTTALLLARCVARHAPKELGPPAGLLAGVGFGIAGGAIQAVSWTSAWSSVLYVLFGIAALDALLRARKSRPGPWRAAGGVLLCLAVVTKAPAVVVPAAVALALAASAFAAGRARVLRAEALVLVLAVGAGLFSRFRFLGSLALRHEDRTAPSALEALELVPNGLRAVGQALYPWNRDALFAGEEPLFARGAQGILDAPWIAALFVLPWIVVALVFVARARKPLFLLAVTLLPCLLPPALLYRGEASNVIARTTYLPMALVMAGLGVACAGLWTSKRLSGAGLAGAVLLAAFLADGTVHVARTELAHARDLRASRALIDELAAEEERERPGRELLVLALVPEAGFGGIPSLGVLFPRAFEPPFAERTADVRVFADAADLRLHLDQLALRGRDVVVVGPALDGEWEALGPDPEASGSANRERRRLRRLVPIRPSTAAASQLVAEGSSRWRCDPPLGAHEAPAIELAFTDRKPRGDLVLHQGDLERRIRVAPPLLSAGRIPIVIEPPLELLAVFGPPIEAFEWTTPSEGLSLALLEALPTLLSAAPDVDQELLLQTVPTFRVGLPEDLRLLPPAFARLELRFTDRGRSVSLYCDVELTEAFAAQVEIAPASLHVEGDAPAPLAPDAGESWPTFVSERIVPPLDQRRRAWIPFTWRVTLHHAGGAPAARSPFQQARFVRP